MSDLLLQRENEALAEIAGLFAGFVPPLLAGLDGSRPVTVMGPFHEGVRRSQVLAGNASVGVVDRLVRTAVDVGLEAVGDELLMCEGTMPKRYVGVAKAGWNAGRGAADGICEKAQDAYRSAVATALVLADREVADQIRIAKDSEELGRRLFSTDPVRLPGRSGRGAFWAAVGGLQARARAVTIDAVNEARTAAMLGMNEAAGAR